MSEKPRSSAMIMTMLGRADCVSLNVNSVWAGETWRKEAEIKRMRSERIS